MAQNAVVSFKPISMSTSCRHRQLAQLSSASASIKGFSPSSVTNGEWLVSCLPPSKGAGSLSSQTPEEIALALSARTTRGDIAVETLPRLLPDLQGEGIRVESPPEPRLPSHLWTAAHLIKPVQS